MTTPQHTSTPLDSARDKSLSARICATCSNYEPSRLVGYGYCKSAPTLETLARLVAIGSACVFDRWHAKGRRAYPQGACPSDSRHCAAEPTP